MMSPSRPVGTSTQPHEPSTEPAASAPTTTRSVTQPSRTIQATQAQPVVTPAWKDQQSHVLPHKKLMVVFPVLALAQFTSYLDQTSVSTALPAIGSDLGLGPSISWVAASFLIAGTSIQLINGRLSDIFGRKQLLITALALLGVGNLCTGFATGSPMLFAFRAVSGFGGGMINALVMITASDITTLRQRGKYNGFIGAAVALGNGLGPLLGGVLTERAGWRWSFWYIVPWIAFVATMLAIVLPPSRVTTNVWTKLRLIDWVGVGCNVAAVVMLLVPVSEGGSLLSWDSATVISLLVVGAVMIMVFLLVEWKVAPLPIMPLRLFTNDLSANIILIQGVLFGVVFWGNLFYVPIYLQNVLGYSPIVSGAAIIPMVASQGIGSIISGQIISKTGHYNPTIITSQGLWTVGVALQTIYSRTTPIWAVCLIGFLQGCGVGGAFQPSLVALLAHSRKADRAVMNSLRNFLRTVGGAVGLTISGTILNNTLRTSLSTTLSPAQITSITAAAYTIDTLGLTSEQHDDVLNAYMDGIHTIFVLYAPLIGVCFLAALFVRDSGVAEKDATKQEKDEAMGKTRPDDGVELQPLRSVDDQEAQHVPEMDPGTTKRTG